MNQLNHAQPEPSHEEIALQAFLLWEKEGRQSGREMTYWLQAEAQIRQTRQQQVEAAAKAIRQWPPAATSKLATARAITPATPKAAKPVAAVKTAPLSKPVRKAAGSARKALARN